MEKNNYILVSLDDPRAKKIAQVVGNKTSQKILNYLGENSKKSEEDISTALKIPLNTVGYNIKQLLDTELIEKTNNFFWSKKGKKISLYQVSNKSIIFSPKKTNLSSQIKSILPVSFLAGIGALAVRLYHPAISAGTNLPPRTMETVSSTAKDSFVSNSNIAGSQLVSSTPNLISLGSPTWWFLGGVLISVIIYIFVRSLIKLEKNYTKIELKEATKKNHFSFYPKKMKEATKLLHSKLKILKGGKNNKYGI